MLHFDFDFDLSDAFQRIADAVEGFLAKVAEPQPAPTYGCEQMKTMLRHLSHALHFGDPAWPHTESQAQLAIRYLEVTAKSLVWGQKHDDSIVACFLDEGGLSILIRALLTYQLPRSIKLQVYQSTCMIAQNAKEELFPEFLKGSEFTDLFLGDPEIDSEEFLQYFLSLIKTIALRAKPEAMHLLLTSNDFPVLRRALMLSAHGDQMVRTQARTAYLTILRGLLDAEVREKAIQLAQEMLPQLLEKFLWSQWASMAEAANRQNAPAFKAAALEEEDTFEHFTELILLGIPEITELVASTVAGAFLARFGCLLSPTLDNNLWNVQFTASYDAAIPYAHSFMIVPSPKSGAVSVSESTMESDGHVDASDTSACTGEYPHDPQCGICEDVKTLELCPFNAALAWRTLASFTNIFRDANLGGVVLPLVELVTLPFVPTSLLNSIWQLKSGQPTKELAKFSEELAACAMEDVALSAWPGDVSKLKHEHWRCQLRCAPGLVRRDGEANPFRELLMSTLGTPGCGLSATSFISSPQCNMSSLHSVSTNTSAGMLMAQLEALYPHLLEDVQMIARPIEAKEEEPNNNSGTLGSLAENISWLLTAAGFGNAECSLISDPGAISKMGE